MIFETPEFCIDIATYEDIRDILGVYNSNVDFLEKHMNKSFITEEWLEGEIEEMKKAGFTSSKIIEKVGGKTIGSLDFKVSNESYLSLLILHKDYRSNGYGNKIYRSFEKYIKSCGSKCIRIDVVSDYNDKVTKFWAINGYKKFADVKLNWTGKELPAVTMKKLL